MTYIHMFYEIDSQALGIKNIYIIHTDTLFLIKPMI
jgi:hypothetical protein